MRSNTIRLPHPLPKVLDGVHEYTERYPVELVEHNGKLCVRAQNEGGNNEVLIDAHELRYALARFQEDQEQLTKTWTQ